MNIDKSVKLSLENFDKSNMDSLDLDELMSRLDESYEASQNDAQLQKIWVATIVGILFFLEKQKMRTTELTALRQLFHALSNSAAGARETRLNYPWSGSRGNKSYSILDEEKRARAIVALENANPEERKVVLSSAAKYLGKTEEQTKAFCRNFRNNLIASTTLVDLVNLYRKRFKKQQPFELLN
jgi:acyl carrier protein